MKKILIEKLNIKGTSDEIILPCYQIISEGNIMNFISELPELNIKFIEVKSLVDESIVILNTDKIISVNKCFIHLSRSEPDYTNTRGAKLPLEKYETKVYYLNPDIYDLILKDREPGLYLNGNSIFEVPNKYLDVIKFPQYDSVKNK